MCEPENLFLFWKVKFPYPGWLSNTDNIWGKGSETYQPNSFFHRTLQAPEKCDSERSLAKGALGNDVLANLMYLPYWKCSTLFKMAKDTPSQSTSYGMAGVLAYNNTKFHCQTYFPVLQKRPQWNLVWVPPCSQLWPPQDCKSLFLIFSHYPLPLATMSCPVQHALLVISSRSSGGLCWFIHSLTGFWADLPL